MKRFATIEGFNGGEPDVLFEPSDKNKIALPEFETMQGAMNYMASLGWKLEHTYAIPVCIELDDPVDRGEVSTNHIWVISKEE